MSEKATCGVLVPRRLSKLREDIAMQAFQQCRRQINALNARIAQLSRVLAEEETTTRLRLLEADATMSTSQYRMGKEEIRAAISRDRALLAGLTETLRRRREELLDAMNGRKALDRLGGEPSARQELTACRQPARRQDGVFATHAASRIDQQES